jgi:aminopeptidase N
MRPVHVAARAAAIIVAALAAGCGTMSLRDLGGRLGPHFGPHPCCAPPQPADSQPMEALAPDPQSFARPAEARVTHVGIDLRADFDRHVLSGAAVLDIRMAPGAHELVLDTRDLTIKRVTVGGREARFQLGEAVPLLGRPLSIQLPPGARRVSIEYETSPDAAALQWLSPAQTAGKREPYLFSQGEAILTRTWVPTQDSPGIRQTWSATITAPAALRTVMSGEALTPEGQPQGAGWKSWRFNMDKPVPPYLIAIAIGDVAFKPLGPRTGVYTEPSMMDLASSELVDMGKMVEAAEALFGPYRWGRYDVLILPPSFPYGGMENPRLTFATPTMLAGDRSLVSLIAHELAHSWSGNLVTNATWNDFWLNEGFTNYAETRIMERLEGVDRAKMLEVLSWTDWMDGITEAGGPTSPDTRLHMDYAGRDPDEIPGGIVYDKGAAYLRTIERTVGRERFDAWLRSYFDRHAFQPMTSELFLADLRANLIKGDQELEARLMLDAWVYSPGIPANAVEPQSDLFDSVDTMVRFYAAGRSTATGLTTSEWSTQQWLRFLGELPRKMDRAKLDELERTFHFSETGNSEIRFLWLRLAIANRYDPALPSLEQFLSSQGRRKFVAPLFTDLMAQGDWGQPIARRIYAKTRAGYHPVTAVAVDAVVK